MPTSLGMRYRLLSLVVLAACTENQDAKDYYDAVETGSSWQISIDSGNHVDDHYQGACPAFAPRTAHVPADDSLACDPGCTCAFGFALEDDGEIGHRYAVDAGFEQQCDDGSSILCTDPDPMHGEVGFCTWTSGTIDPQVDPFGDCSYSFTLGPS